MLLPLAYALNVATRLDNPNLAAAQSHVQPVSRTRRSWARALARKTGALIAALRRAIDHRLTVQRLARLTDHQLRDIGVERSSLGLHPLVDKPMRAADTRAEIQADRLANKQAVIQVDGQASGQAYGQADRPCCQFAV